jgi:hypothetical protein
MVNGTTVYLGPDAKTLNSANEFASACCVSGCLWRLVLLRCCLCLCMSPLPAQQGQVLPGHLLRAL